MKSTPIGICVIGAGRAGMIHARNFDSGRIAGAQLVAIAEPSEEVRGKASEELHLEQVYAECREAMANSKVDAVVVAPLAAETALDVLARVDAG